MSPADRLITSPTLIIDTSLRSYTAEYASADGSESGEKSEESAGGGPVGDEDAIETFAIAAGQQV